MHGYAIIGRGRRSDRPSIKELNGYVAQEFAVKGKELGFQLLNNESAQYTLEIIEADHKGEVSILPPRLWSARACAASIIYVITNSANYVVINW